MQAIEEVERELSDIRGVVREFSSWRYATLTRRIIFRLQRIPATGIYEMPAGHRTLWDEYCYLVQVATGDPEMEWGWEETIKPFFRWVTDGLPEQEARLLSLYAAWDLGEPDEELLRCGGIDRSLIESVLSQTLAEQANLRLQARFAE